jgi:iron-sulfur cluster insertion protein
MESVTNTNTTPAPEQGIPGIVLTDAAARKVQQLILEERNPELKLRVYISGGGCSGWSIH